MSAPAPTPARRVSRRPRLPLFLLSLALLAGCTGEPPAAEPGETPEPAAEASAARTYTVLGVVRQLPNPSLPGRPEVQILHQAIPDFVNSAGYETGMPGMTMPFPLADGISLEGITVGAWVEFTFTVDWDGEPPLLLTAIRPLAETP